jgi:DNA invertase Pin-like site-specific DNA recombinase
VNEKITSEHLARKAMLYIRQSSPHQVVHHQESRRLQYAMEERLRQLGWSEIETVDEDQGRSAAGQVARSGFERVVSEVSLGRVGAVAARELSRFSRNSRDWQQLTEVCRVVNTLLIDQETIYDPRRSDDRLLLGLKGTLNEYELDLLRHRGLEARQKKAQRGELLCTPPVGYVRGLKGYEKDPDQRVQQSLEQVYAKFLELGSVRQVLFWYVEQELSLPTRRAGPAGWQTCWRRPNYAALYHLLTHPIYAGAYVYGRRPKPPKRPVGCPGLPAVSSARVLLTGRHEGYITWETFERIQRMLADNQQSSEEERRGAARSGAALLAGLLRCRRCGHKMMVDYTGRAHEVLRYSCRRAVRDNGEARCIEFGGGAVDAAIGHELIGVLRPAVVEAALRVEREQGREKDQVLQALELELKAARYTAERAGRQYDLTDPANRLVAQELERRWNQALAEVSQIEGRIAREQNQRPAPDLPPASAFVALGPELEKIWEDPTTDPRLKKRIARVLLEEVIADVNAEAGEILLTLHWQGGVHTELKVARRRRGQNRLHTVASTVEAVQLLSRISEDQYIAAWLNRNQLRTGKGNWWSQEAVASLRSKRGIPRHSAERQQAEGWLTLSQAAESLGISTTTLRLAVEAAEVPGIHPLPSGPWIFKRSELEQPCVKRLVERTRERRGKAAEPDPKQLGLLYATT